MGTAKNFKKIFYVNFDRCTVTLEKSVKQRVFCFIKNSGKEKTDAINLYLQYFFEFLIFYLTFKEN